MLLVTTINTSISGQYPTDLKTGLYNNLEDLLNNNPAYESKLNVEHRTYSDIKLLGGNDYKVDIYTTNIKKSIIKKSFAIFDGDRLFINGKHINGYLPYCKVENNYNNRFLIIKAGIPRLLMKNSVGYEASESYINRALMGGAINGALTGAKLATDRLYYILDCNSGDVKILSIDYLYKILADFPALKTVFDDDYKNDNQEEMLKYIEMLNNE